MMCRSAVLSGGNRFSAVYRGRSRPQVCGRRPIKTFSLGFAEPATMSGRSLAPSPGTCANRQRTEIESRTEDAGTRFWSAVGEFCSMTLSSTVDFCRILLALARGPIRRDQSC